MTQDRPKTTVPDEDGERLEEFRRELEARLDTERANMKKEQNEAILRIEQLSDNSITQAENEWENFQKLLESERDELFRSSMDEMCRLFLNLSSGVDEEDSISRIVDRIIPICDIQEEKTGGSEN
ncbi:MAG TPA: hypothetical protein ENN89_02955 [Synergistetes bacterium]|nr:hypothetical protein [Synergistota bacterium]